MVLKQALPKFEQSFKSNEQMGKVDFLLSVSSNGSIENIKLKNLFPENLPENSIYEMIRNSKYASRSAKIDEANCGVENFEFRSRLDHVSQPILAEAEDLAVVGPR